ncbi:LA_1612 family putative O-antigen biosynthesis protein [Leptospira santarosai]|uniref:LA_1612 family putative O-antigen biosynthesis protein n=1 Tax=Leptospira santarosai TaxID=28183 RepID=UPI00077368CB|nr:LA_1612 family putative O-antigen biosynthesis protein [Leptospira santarosai]
MKFSTLSNSFIRFCKGKMNWKRPRNASVLIYDRVGAELFFEYIENSEIEVLDTRGESLNLYVLLKVILTGKVSLNDYIRQYIQFVSPSVIITFIDNNKSFYSLKQIFPKIIFIFVQNGVRGEQADIFDTLIPDSDYYVDYMLVHGSHIGKKYRDYIQGESIVTGSLKNNKVFKKHQQVEKGSILFISQYQGEPLNDETLFYIDPKGRKFTCDQFFTAEKIILGFLNSYISRNRLALTVCGRSDNQTEYSFFESYLKGSNWKFLSKRTSQESYETVDGSEIIVFIDSTLGYESFGRGKKCAAFPIRDITMQNDATKFGWPGDYPDNGPFWTNKPEETEFCRVMDFVFNISGKDWESIHQQFAPGIMKFDPGNSIFLNLLKRLSVPVKDY